MTSARKATLLLLSTTAIWGSTFFTSQAGMRAIGRVGGESAHIAATFLFSILRFAPAALLFLILVPRSWKGLRNRPEFVGSFWVAFFGFLGMTAQGWALMDGSSTITSFLVNMTVISTPMYGVLFFREKVSRGQVVGAFLAVAGVFVLTNPIHGGFGWPEFWGLLAAVFYGLQIQLIGVVTKGRDSEAMTLGMFFHFAWLNLVALPLAPGGIALLANATKVIGPDPSASGFGRWAVAGSTLYLALFGSVIAMWVFMRYQREIPAWRAAIIYCLEPAFAALFGWMFAGDALSWRILAGGGVIMLANLAPELLKAPERAPHEPGSAPSPSEESAR